MRAYSKTWIGSENLCFDSREENIMFNPDRTYILYALYLIDINRATERKKYRNRKKERRIGMPEGGKERKRKEKEVARVNSLGVN